VARLKLAIVFPLRHRRASEGTDHATCVFDYWMSKRH
jgi:hypothetical protein